jgi:C4-dicarboxylate transporter, DctM subunit
MEQILFTLLLATCLLGLLASGVWVALSLLVVGMLGMALFTAAPIGQVMATVVWGSSHDWALAALPMFIWMGEILFRSRLSEQLFNGLAPWLGRLPGGLLHVNVLGCGLFAAISGSSAATAATVGKMAIPELERRGYPPRMVVGTLAGSGTLGLLIPPSIILIVYGVAAQESIARLFIAGVVPGLLLVALFMGYIGLWALVRREQLPRPDARVALHERVVALRRLLPIVLLIGGIFGSIYFGLASPTDAAAVGVGLALLLSWRAGTLDWRAFREGLVAATHTSCMIALILAGAAFLSVAMGFAGIPRALAGWIGELGLSPYALIVALTIFFILLGCFLDGISVVVLTTSVILPLVQTTGIDLIWFGIYIVLVVEMSQITPPVGFNLFVLQNLTGHSILYVARAALPFFLLLLLAVILLVLWPGLATWLPSRMAG